MTRRFRHIGFGMLIDSELELPELPLASASETAALPDLTIRLGTVPPIAFRATMTSEVAFNVVGAAFLITGGRDILVDPRPDADPAGVRLVLLGRVMGFLFRQKGWLPLHASGVALSAGTGECILFLGPARAGKSTIAAAFHESGYTVITDDMAPVRSSAGDHCEVQSGVSFVRLHPDAATVLRTPGVSRAEFQYDKYRWALGNGQLLDRYVARRIYALEFGELARVEPLSRAEAAMLLSRYSFVKHRRVDQESIENHLRNCASVANAVPLRRLIRRQALDGLTEAVRLVESDLAEDHF